MYQMSILSNGQKSISILKNGVRTSFTENPENTDYQRYLAWVAEGNTPEIIE